MIPARMLASLAVSAPRASEPQILDLDGTVFVTLGLFSVVLLVLNRWLWKPYLEVRDRRSERVEGCRNQAARLEEEAAARLARIEAGLAEARREGTAERSRARAEAYTHEQAILAEAQAAAHEALAEARARLDAAYAAEAARLSEQAEALGREIAGRVLGREAA